MTTPTPEAIEAAEDAYRKVANGTCHPTLRDVLTAALTAAYPLMEAQAKAEALRELTAEGLLDLRAGLALAHDSWNQGASTMLQVCNDLFPGDIWEKPVSPYSAPLLHMIKEATIEGKSE